MTCSPSPARCSTGAPDCPANSRCSCRRRGPRRSRPTRARWSRWWRASLAAWACGTCTPSAGGTRTRPTSVATDWAGWSTRRRPTPLLPIPTSSRVCPARGNALPGGAGSVAPRSGGHHHGAEGRPGHPGRGGRAGSARDRDGRRERVLRQRVAAWPSCRRSASRSRVRRPSATCTSRRTLGVATTCRPRWDWSAGASRANSMPRPRVWKRRRRRRRCSAPRPAPRVATPWSSIGRSPPRCSASSRQALSAEAVQKGRSLFAGRVGEQVAAAQVRLVDDGLHPDGMASAPFDDEGVPHELTPLIEEGVLRGFLHNSYTARREGGGARSTGNASRGSYRAAPGRGADQSGARPGSGLAPGPVRPGGPRACTW